MGITNGKGGGNGNKTRLNLGSGMGMEINHWEWEEWDGLKGHSRSSLLISALRYSSPKRVANIFHLKSVRFQFQCLIKLSYASGKNINQL